MRWNRKALISTALIVAGGILALIGYAEMLSRPEFGLSRSRVWIESILLTGGMIVWPFWGPPLGLQRINDIPLVLEVARFVLPLGVFSGAALLLVRVFGAKARAFGARFSRGHIVVCAGGPAAWQFAADVRQHSADRVVVLDLDRTHTDDQDEHGFPVLRSADPLQESFLLRAAVPSARAIVALGNDDVAGVEVMLLAKSVAAKHRSAHAPPLVARAALSGAAAEDAAQALFGVHDRSFAFRPISVARNAVRLLLRTHPLDRDPVVRDGGRPHVRIVGFDRVGQELALEVARSGHFVDPRPPLITIFDPDAERLLSRLSERRPELGQAAEFRLLTGAIEGLALAKVDPGEAPYSRTVVCMDDEIRGLQAAAALGRRAAAATPSTDPIFVHLARASVAAQALRAAAPHASDLAIVPFGDTASLFTRDIVLEETLDSLAREVHGFYQEHRAADEPDATLTANRPWDDLPEGFRDAGRHQADHMLAKLRLIGCDAVRGVTSPPFSFTPDEIERLSHIEHRRWSAERRVAGWRFAPTRQDEAREHPSLVPWDDLSESEREKDREAVRVIPAILARIGFAIRRSS